MGKSATKAKNKYNNNNYDRIPLIVPKGRKDQIDNFIKVNYPDGSKSRNQFINESIEFYIGKLLKKEQN